MVRINEVMHVMIAMTTIAVVRMNACGFIMIIVL
jgi:hypothetical protein